MPPGASPIHASDCRVRRNPAGVYGVELVADRSTDWAGPQADGVGQCSASASGIAGRGACIAPFGAHAYAATPCENDVGGRFTIRPSRDSHRPSCLSAGAEKPCGTAAGSTLAHRRQVPWRERPPSPRARCGIAPSVSSHPRPCLPGVAPGPAIPCGKAKGGPEQASRTCPAMPNSLMASRSANGSAPASKRRSTPFPEGLLAR